MQRTGPKNQGSGDDSKAAILTKIALECAKALGISPADTATILSVSQGALAAMKEGKRELDLSAGEGECAEGLIRITKLLRTHLGDADTNWRSWIRRENAEMDGKPLDLMLQRYGVLKVAKALEGRNNLPK